MKFKLFRAPENDGGAKGPLDTPRMGGALLPAAASDQRDDSLLKPTDAPRDGEPALTPTMSAPKVAHHGGGPPPEALGIKRKTFAAALIQIMIADVTMSLDNVLAVAGAAHEHPWIMVFGLILSIALMGLAATFIAKLLTKHRWIGYVGLVIVLYVALHMVWDGARSVIVRTDRMDAFNASAPAFLDISAEEKAKFLKGVSSEDTTAPATGLPPGPTDGPPPAATVPPAS